MFPKELKGVENVQEFAKGKRGIIYTGTIDGRKVAVKVQRTDIGAKGTVDHEADMLEFLNNYKIGPTLIGKGKDYIVYLFVEGEFLPEWMKTASKLQIRKVLMEIFTQCHLMDRLGYNKEEMHRPYKHILVKKKFIGFKVTLLDFERAKKTEKPQNVTQFIQFITSSNISPLLKEKGFKIEKEKMMELAKNYKHDPSRWNYTSIIMMLK